MKIAAIPSDHVIVIDGVPMFGIDFSDWDLKDKVNAIHWDDAHGEGHIEHLNEKGQVHLCESITDFSEHSHLVDRYNKAKQIAEYDAAARKVEQDKVQAAYEARRTAARSKWSALKATLDLQLVEAIECALEAAKYT